LRHLGEDATDPGTCGQIELFCLLPDEPIDLGREAQIDTFTRWEFWHGDNLGSGTGSVKWGLDGYHDLNYLLAVCEPPTGATLMNRRSFLTVAGKAAS
jgi:hypothetical protein